MTSYVNICHLCKLDSLAAMLRAIQETSRKILITNLITKIPARSAVGKDTQHKELVDSMFPRRLVHCPPAPWMTTFKHPEAQTLLCIVFLYVCMYGCVLIILYKSFTQCFLFSESSFYLFVVHQTER